MQVSAVQFSPWAPFFSTAIWRLFSGPDFIFVENLTYFGFNTIFVDLIEPYFVVICGLIMIFDLVAAVRGFDLHQIHAEIIDRRHRLFVAPRQIAVMQKTGYFVGFTVSSMSPGPLFRDWISRGTYMHWHGVEPSTTPVNGGVIIDACRL